MCWTSCAEIMLFMVLDLMLPWRGCISRIRITCRTGAQHFYIHHSCLPHECTSTRARSTTVVQTYLTLWLWFIPVCTDEGTLQSTYIHTSYNMYFIGYIIYINIYIIYIIIMCTRTGYTHTYMSMYMYMYVVCTLQDCRVPKKLVVLRFTIF